MKRYSLLSSVIFHSWFANITTSYFSLLYMSQHYKIKMNVHDVNYGNVMVCTCFIAWSTVPVTFLGRPLGETLRLHAPCVSVCVCQTFRTLFLCCSYLFNAKGIGFVYGVLMPYNVGNIMWVGILGSKVIKGSC